jgi:hypothetical protein
MTSKNLGSISLFPVLLLTGCSLECTLIGCNDGVNVQYSAALAPGDYEVDIATSLGSATCSLTVTAEGSADQCSGTLANVTAGSRQLFVPGRPTDIAIQITGEAGEVADDSFTPDYEVSQPNGPGCGPECHNAEVELDVSGS